MGIAFICRRIGLSSTCLLRSGEGLPAIPVGVAMLSATMNSSKFMGSEVERFNSDDFRSWAIPLGAFAPELCRKNDGLAPYQYIA